MKTIMSSDKLYLRPWNLLDVEGKLAYNEGAQAWNTLRFKKEVLTEFPQLKEKRSKLFYGITFIKTYDDLINFIKKMQKENKPLPLLLWFYKLKELPSTI